MTKQPHWLAPLLALAIVAYQQPALHAAPAPQETAADSKQLIARQVVETPTGTVVELRLHNKSKVRGRLGNLSADRVEVLVADGGAVKTQTVPLDEIKSFKRKSGSGRSTGLLVLAGVGVAMSVFFVIGLIAVATGAD